jgi:hypothetical protein
MSNERLHEAALQILQKKGITPAAASAEQYRQAAEQAQSEGVEYETHQAAPADLWRQLEQERSQLLVEFELGQMGTTLDDATPEQLSVAIDKAGKTIEAAKQPVGPITTPQPIGPIRQPKTEEEK